MLEKIKEVPSSPGCYIYFNKYDDIIYVGKAKNLKYRMSSYFNRVHNIKTSKLIEDIVRFEYLLTNNEMESLILENQLIKKYKPKYNILLKDDRTYPYMILTKETHPRLIKSRKKNLKGYYYGPFISEKFVTEMIKFINNNSKIRKCDILPKQKCIYYDLNLCYGPCIHEEIDDTIEISNIRKLLEDNFSGIKKLLKEQRNKKASLLEFEQAKIFQDLLYQIDEFKVGQSLDISFNKSFDAIGYYITEDWISLTILRIISGVVSNIHFNLVPYFGDCNQELLSQIYQYNLNFKIKYIYLKNIELNEVVKNLFITEKINLNKKDEANLNNFLMLNAKEYYKNNVDMITKKYFSDRKKGFEKLLSLTEGNLKYIEMFDVSHSNGANTVGVRVTYVNGKKNRKYYRKYKIKQDTNGNDYKATQEILERRLNKIEDYIPNLIIVDGGIGLVRLAESLIQKRNLKIKVLGLIKDDKHTTKEIINSVGKRFKLNKKDDLYKFLYQMQEEVHRFAINYHKQSQTNSMLLSKLDSINGIGPVKKKLLLEKFGSFDKIKETENVELLKIINQKIIDKIKDNTLK